ncbi:MAG: hypothetical protein JWR75_1224 [Devosia sp.]|nr:hypothetical protein [Devosia sp.]
MKITLDLTALIESGKLSAVEAERLKGLAATDTGSFGINVVLAFGIIAVSLGLLAVMPSPLTAVVLGGLLFGTGLALTLSAVAAWRLLAQILMPIGALMLGGGAYVLAEGWTPLLFVMAAGFAVAAAFAGSGTLAAVAVLTLSAGLGAFSGYMQAYYFVGLPAPTLTIGVFSVLTLGLYLVSLRVPARYERLAIIGARTAILIINLAFLIGAILGDSQAGISPTMFVYGWAAALLAVGGWGVYANRRWVVNVAATFAGLHFYTQWFIWFGANSITLLAAGLLLIVFGLGLYALNSWLARQRSSH